MKKIKYLLYTLLCLSAPLYGDSSASAPPNPFDTAGPASPSFSEANAQAIYWINLIDQFQFNATWYEASGLLRDVVSEQQWAAAMKHMRYALGPVMARKVSTHQFTHHLTYGTQGYFCIIQFETQYQRLSNAFEKITLMSEGPLFQWKVVSYDIGSR